MEREIVVRGTGEARALPDLASLRVEVTADHKTQEEAHDARTKLAASVDEVLSRHADAIARTTIASLLVQPRTRWHRGEDIRSGWRASRTSFVDVVTLDALGEIMAGLVDAGAAVQGPQWSMAPTNPAYDQARASRRRGRPPAGAVVRRRRSDCPWARWRGWRSRACGVTLAPPVPLEARGRADGGRGGGLRATPSRPST